MPISSERELMGTRFAVTCHHLDEALVRKAIAAAFDEAEKINTVASDYIADSELLSLSRQPVGKPTPVSPLLFSLVREARDYAEKTGGLFDPTLGPLTKLWRESRRRKALPDSITLGQARAASGWKHLILDAENSTVTFAVPRMRLDLGGIAKGQAADAMLATLKNHGIPSSSVTAGGDVRLGDPPPGEEGWKIGVRTSDKTRDSDILRLSNCAVSTSGDLQQFVEIDGVRYAHIIDPATGLGLTRHVAATVISPNSTLSDALATACCVADARTAGDMAKALGAKLIRIG
jgi:thiamine biosynthesis lipoprotein